MVAINAPTTVQTLEICLEDFIDASPEIVFDAVLEQLGPANATGPDSPLPVKIEPWPGGRWYRDLGDNAGHFWGHVQVIKPPSLIEICGPLCMSYPALNHIQYRLTPKGEGTLLTFTHRAIGEIIAEHRDGMPGGWAHELGTIRKLAEKRSNALEP